ncbi:hypothetical protein L6255_01260 [Candidatus Parcubacteria bacterium]|nr:hypothetical protein [Patescibacteria group bacterium]MBU4381050.1 hypothetical protein [Patescibacteria group bacterium]MCG2689047.1 hypothetical protein [Candidatus Parcubacteria bacterium]
MHKTLNPKRQKSQEGSNVPSPDFSARDAPSSLEGFPISQASVVKAWELLGKYNLWKLLHKKEQFSEKK